MHEMKKVFEKASEKKQHLSDAAHSDSADSVHLSEKADQNCQFEFKKKKKRKADENSEINRQISFFFKRPAPSEPGKLDLMNMESLHVYFYLDSPKCKDERPQGQHPGKSV